MKRWIHSSTQEEIQCSSEITVEYLIENDGCIQIDGYTVEIGHLYNKKDDNYSGGFGKKTCVSNFDKGVNRVFNSPEKAVEFLNKQLNKKKITSDEELPAGYLETTRFTTPYIKTDDQRNALEALEIAIAEKYRQFKTMCDIQFHLTSDASWRGTIDEYPEGYYIVLEVTRAGFQAFVSGDQVIRKPRKLSPKVRTYDVAGTNGRVDYLRSRRS